MANEQVPLWREGEELTTLVPGRVDVWWAKPADADPRLQVLLSLDERRRMATLRQQIDQDRFLVAWGLIRLVLSAYLRLSPTDIAILRRCMTCGGLHGKPSLAKPQPAPIEFSLSHSGDKVVAVFGITTPIGVDVEQVQYQLPIDEIVPQALTTAEAAALTTLSPTERVRSFLLLWTRKEAVVKAIGAGLAAPLTSFTVSGPSESPRVVAASSAGVQPISLHTLNAGPRHVATAAVVGSYHQVVECNGSALLASYRSHFLARS